MKFSIRFFLFFLTSSLYVLSVASQEVSPCMTSQKNKLLMEKFPESIKATEALELFTQNSGNKDIQVNEIYVIPIVFHIVHANGVENVSKEQVLDAVRCINEDFRKLNTDTSFIIPEFKSIAADCRIEFRLAQLDPFGNCTDGIERTVSDLTYEADDDIKYEALSWDRSMYLNIWVVNSIGGGAAGYAYYPGSVDGYWGQDIDGILIQHNYIGSIGTSSSTKSTALTHEIGHYLNLRHTWGNSNDPGLASNCDEDDLVNDTPETIGHTTCSISAQSCGSLDNVQNYMEYSYCSRMYTEGQKTRMRVALNSYTSSRNNLWKQNNLIATGTNDGYFALCAPQADFDGDLLKGCQGFEVTFADKTANTIIDSCSFYWVFDGGDPATSILQNPTVNFPVSGYHNISLTVTNSTGSDMITKAQYVYSVDTLDGLQSPFYEDIEYSGFPISQIGSDKDWVIESEDAANWTRTGLASSSGDYSMYIRNINNAEGAENALVSPNINLSDANDPLQLTFKVAYAKQSVYSKDVLQVKVSRDCGVTWSIRYYKQGSSSLVTNGGTIVTGNYIPSANEWRLETIDLSAYDNDDYLMFKFQSTSKLGNNLYIDDINISETTSGKIESSFEELDMSFAPNPFSNEIHLLVKNNRSSSCKVVVKDISGKITGMRDIRFSNNSPSPSITDLFPYNSGVYFVEVASDSYRHVYKVIRIL